MLLRIGGRLSLPFPVLLDAEPGLLPLPGLAFQQAAGVVEPVVDHDTVLCLVGIFGFDQGVQKLLGVALPHNGVGDVLGVIGREVSVLGEVHGPIPEAVQVPHSGRDGNVKEAGKFFRFRVSP